MIQLRLSGLEERLFEIPFEPCVLQVGRDPANDIVLPDEKVALFHATLRRRGGLVEVVAREQPVTVVGPHGPTEVERAEMEPPLVLRLGHFELHLAGPPADFTGASAVSEGTGRFFGSGTLSKTPPPSTTPARLFLRLEPDGPELPLGGSPVRIGKGPDNDLVVDDKFVSGQHCRVVQRGPGHILFDLSSRNGTFVNGAKISMVELQAGVQVVVGTRELTVGRLGEDAAGRRGVQRFYGMLSGDRQMQAVFDRITKIGPQQAPVLVLGETGTGKELVARALHSAGARPGGPMVTLNCGAVSPALIESELFGHERGAFTGATSRRRGVFEEASGGTLFLDEIGELPMAMQPKLLRVLETQRVRRVGAEQELPVDVRVVAATHRPLQDEIHHGRFRLDLFHRLAVHVLRLPPLRARGGDVALLIGELLREARTSHGARSLGAETMEALCRQAWPGNVRELRNAVARALAEGGRELSYSDFLGAVAGECAAGAGVVNGDGGLAIRAGGRKLDDIEREAIQIELSRQGGNRRKTAVALGVARSTLGDKLKKLGLGR